MLPDTIDWNTVTVTAAQTCKLVLLSLKAQDISAMVMLPVCSCLWCMQDLSMVPGAITPSALIIWLVAWVLRYHIPVVSWFRVMR